MAVIPWNTTIIFIKHEGKLRNPFDMLVIFINYLIVGFSYIDKLGSSNYVLCNFTSSLIRYMNGRAPVIKTKTLQHFWSYFFNVENSQIYNVLIYFYFNSGNLAFIHKIMTIYMWDHQEISRSIPIQYLLFSYFAFLFFFFSRKNKNCTQKHKYDTLSHCSYVWPVPIFGPGSRR